MTIQRSNYIGFIGPLIGLVGVLISTLLLPGFDWSYHALSDLGSWFRTDLGQLQLVSAITFNGGLLISGFSTAYSAYYLFKSMKHRPSAFSMLVFAQTGALLFLVGIFSEDLLVPHALAAMGFFLTIPLAMGIMGIGLLFKRELRALGVVTLIGGVLAFLAMFSPWAGIAPRELAEALIAILWLWALNALQIRGALSSILYE